MNIDLKNTGIAIATTSHLTNICATVKIDDIDIHLFKAVVAYSKHYLFEHLHNNYIDYYKKLHSFQALGWKNCISLTDL